MDGDLDIVALWANAVVHESQPVHAEKGGALWERLLAGSALSD